MRIMTEKQLLKDTPLDHRDKKLKLNFWYEYELAQREKRRMEYENIWFAICHEDYWNDLVNDVVKVCWLTRPIQDYMLTMREMLYTGMDRLREIIEAPPFDLNGIPNTALMNTQMKAFKMIDERVRGAIPQTLHIKGQHTINNVTDPGNPMITLPTEVVGHIAQEHNKQIENLSSVDSFSLDNLSLENIEEQLLVIAQERENKLKELTKEKAAAYVAAAPNLPKLGDDDIADVISEEPEIV